MSAHTEGRIQARVLGEVMGQPLLDLVDQNGEVILARCLDETPYVFNEQDARRLAACWNACEGLPTEALETAPPIAERITIAIAAGDNLDAELAKRTAERDQLRAEIAALTSDEATAHDLLVAEIKKTGQLHHELAAARALLGDILTTSNAVIEEMTDAGEEIDLGAQLMVQRIRNLLGENAKPTVKALAQRAVYAAAAEGMVLTVSQRPRLPPAMGNYETVIEVRPARVMAEKGGA